MAENQNVGQRPVLTLAETGHGSGVPAVDLAQLVGRSAVFKLDRHGHVLTWSAEAQRMLGHTREEIVGRHYSIFNDGWRDALPPAPPDVLSDTRYEEGWRVRKDGSKFWASVALTPVYEDGGRLAGFSMMMRDDTRHRDAVEQQEAAEAIEARLQATEALVHHVVERLFDVGLSLSALSTVVEQPHVATRVQKVTDEVDQTIRHIRTSMWALGLDGERPVADTRSDSEVLHLLVVDDDEDMRALFTAVLSDLGRVHAVADAYQALAHIEHNSVDVLVLDVLLPGANGIDLLERVRNLGHDVPAVIVSGVDGGSLHERALASGAAVIMSKPFDGRLLKASVLEAVRTGQRA